MKQGNSIKKAALNLYLENRQKLKQKEAEFYAGKGVYCPVCQSEFSSFAPWFGDIVIENVRCPNCECMDRHRFLWIYLFHNKSVSTSERKRLLHFAPQRHFYDYFRNNPNTEYYPCDLEPEKYELNYGGKLFKTDILNLKFPSSYFDLIICSHILEHVADDKKALSELHRVLNKDGLCIIQVPVDPSLEKNHEDLTSIDEKDRIIRFRQKDHLRLYGKDFSHRLREVGFVVTEVFVCSLLNDEDAKLYGIDTGEVIFCCRKQF